MAETLGKTVATIILPQGERRLPKLLLTDRRLETLQVLDNEIEICVHTHAYTSTMLATRNFIGIAAALLREQTGVQACLPGLAEDIEYLGKLKLIPAEAFHWADAVMANGENTLVHSVDHAQATKAASFARVVFRAIRHASSALTFPTH